MLSEQRQLICLPTESQELFVKAALLDGEEARSAWCRWQRAYDIDRLDHELTCFLPQLWRNLIHWGMEDVWAETIGLHVRSIAARNRILVERSAAVLSRLTASGVPTLMVSGIPLFIGNGSHRPIQSIDVCIPQNRIRESLDCLRQGGWCPGNTHISSSTATDFFDFNEVVSLQQPDDSPQEDMRVDLSWLVIGLSCAPEIDRLFWDESIPFHVHDVETKTLNGTDLLLTSCLRGMTVGGESTLNWIADVAAIVRTVSIDWLRLIDMTDRTGSGLFLSTGFHYCVRLLDLPIPDRVLTGLERMPASRRQRRTFSLTVHRDVDASWRSFFLNWMRYSSCSRQRCNSGILAKPSLFIRYLQLRWRVHEPLRIPVAAAMALYRHSMRCLQRTHALFSTSR